jgi:hypothetical protein
MDPQDVAAEDVTATSTVADVTTPSATVADLTTTAHSDLTTTHSDLTTTDHSAAFSKASATVTPTKLARRTETSQGTRLSMKTTMEQLLASALVTPTKASKPQIEGNTPKRLKLTTPEPKCSVCDQMATDLAFTCRDCNKHFCKNCDKEGMVVVPVFCTLCFQSSCNDCAPQCPECQMSGCKSCMELHSCEP